MTLDTDVRLAVYWHLIDYGTVPSDAHLAITLETAEDAIREALERLAAAHMLVLDSVTRAVWMAMPFSAVPTGFQVATARGNRWANCAWDALGIPALLHEDATVGFRYEDTAESAVVAIRAGALEGDGLVHFAVPAAHWWDDVGFT